MEIKSFNFIKAKLFKKLKMCFPQKFFFHKKLVTFGRHSKFRSILKHSFNN